MTELKTKITQASVEEFLNTVPNDHTRQDCWKIVEMMQQATGTAPQMWGPSIVGFGSYHYKYASGHEGDSMLVGFSPRKQNISLYIMAGFEDYDRLLNQLGKFSRAKSCLYVKRLSDVHLPILEKLIQDSVTRMRQIHPSASV